MSDLESSVQIKFLSLLVFNIACQHFMTHKVIKSLDKNWAQIFEKCHSALKLRRVRVID